MYIFDRTIDKYYYLGKIRDEKWEFMNSLEDKVIFEDKENFLERIKNLILEELVENVRNSMIKEEIILVHPTKQQLKELYESSIDRLIYGENHFGSLINDDLMAQIIKETLNITLLHKLKDGNKRASWFFFLFAIKIFYSINSGHMMEELSNREDTINEFSLDSEMNQMILKVSDKGNREIDILKLAWEKCDTFRDELCIINMRQKVKEEFSNDNR